MLSASLKGLAGRKLRTVLTAFAVILGVALISGTYILTDTIQRTFDGIFTEVNKGIDVTVSPKKAFNSDNNNSNPPAFPASFLDKTRSVNGVQNAVGGVFDQGAIIGKDGKRVGNSQAPNFIGSDQPKPFSPFNYTQGAPPTTPGQVALDQHTAKDQGWHMGDTVRIAGQGPQRPYKLSGIAKFGKENSIAGASIAILTLPEAQKVLGKVGKFDTVDIQAAPGLTPDALAPRVRQALPRSVTVRTGAQQGQSDSKDVKDGFGFITTLLLVFAGVALFVGAFMIFNTFSITIAQRTREFSMLRTIGATRRQVLGAVIGEAVVVGVVASVIGLLAGIGMAPALKALFKVVGADLPSGGTVLKSRTIIVSLLVGSLITLIASLVPAFRATRISPIEGIREGSVLPRGRMARARTPFAVVVLVIGIAVMSYGLFGGKASGAALSLLGLGTALVFLGVALMSALFVRPLASLVGGPIERLRGVTGQIARENTVRNAGRTAATSAALMIGLALVVGVTIFAAGLRHSTTGAIEKSLKAGVVVENKDGFSSVPDGTARTLSQINGVRTVSPVSLGGAKVQGVSSTAGVSGVDTRTLASVYEFEWKHGSDATLRSLGRGDTLVSESWSTSHKHPVGDGINVTTQSGKHASYTIRGTYKNNAHFWGDVVVSSATYARDIGQHQQQFVFAGLEPGANAAGVTAAAERAVKAQFPTAEAVTKAKYKDTQTNWVSKILAFFYVLLSLAVIVSLFGIVNTLVLAIYERTRELGMLRAIGTSKRQVRRIVRYESVITAMIGAVLGTVLGVFFAVIVSRPLANEGFTLSFPIGTLVILLILAGLAGVVAAITPARRAAKLNVLEALAYE